MEQLFYKWIWGPGRVLSNLSLFVINKFIDSTNRMAHIYTIYIWCERSKWVLLSVGFLVHFDFIWRYRCVYIYARYLGHTHTHSHPSISMYRNLLPEIYIAILGYYLSLKCDPRYVLYDDGISLRRLKKQKYNKIFGTKLQKHLTNGRRENRNEQTNETKWNGMEYTKNQWSSLSPPFDHNTRTI